MEQLLEWDRSLFFFFNGLHTPWLDPVMYYVSKTLTSLPLYLLLLYFIIKFYKKDSWIVLLGIAVAILLADQITSGFMKPFFERFRPSRDPELDGLVHVVNGYRGGKFGFASSHAANTFATAVFMWLLFRMELRWIGLLFVWAVVVSYTRIYLGVHYPGDIVVGGFIGILCGIVAFRLTARLLLRKGHAV